MRPSTFLLVAALLATYSLNLTLGQACDETLTPTATWQFAAENALAAASGSGAFVLCLDSGSYTGCGSGVALVAANGAPVTVRGIGDTAPVIDCEGNGRAFNVISDDVNATIKNIEATNCADPTSSPYHGGVISIEGAANVTLDSVYFHDSTHSAVFVDGANVVIVNSTFGSNNFTTGNGGSLRAENGAAITVSETVIYLSGANKGGGIAASGAGTNITCTRCTVTENTATELGGGVYAEDCAFVDFTFSSDVTGNTPDQVYVNGSCARVVGLDTATTTSSPTTTGGSGSTVSTTASTTASVTSASSSTSMSSNMSTSATTTPTTTSSPTNTTAASSTTAATTTTSSGSGSGSGSATSATSSGSASTSSVSASQTTSSTSASSTTTAPTTTPSASSSMASTTVTTSTTTPSTSTSDVTTADETTSSVAANTSKAPRTAVAGVSVVIAAAVAVSALIV